PKGRCQRDH
ncbi:hypothetical protein BN1723_020699, partial [Verticillium longisporum]